MDSSGLAVVQQILGWLRLWLPHTAASSLAFPRAEPTPSGKLIKIKMSKFYTYERGGKNVSKNHPSFNSGTLESSNGPLPQLYICELSGYYTGTFSSVL